MGLVKLGMGLWTRLAHILNSFPDLLTEGFNYHEKTPAISQTMINPVIGPTLAHTMLTLLTSQIANELDTAITTGNAQASNQNCPPPPVSLRSKNFYPFCKQASNFSPSNIFVLMMGENIYEIINIDGVAGH